MTEVYLGVNGLSDEGFEGVLRFAKFGGLRKVWVHGNDISVSAVQ
jgi:hypothetical protein